MMACRCSVYDCHCFLCARSSLCFQFLLPVIQIALICLCVGGDPKGIEVAVVNNETSSSAYSISLLSFLDNSSVHQVFILSLIGININSLSHNERGTGTFCVSSGFFSLSVPQIHILQLFWSIQIYVCYGLFSCMTDCYFIMCACVCFVANWVWKCHRAQSDRTFVKFLKRK